MGVLAVEMRELIYAILGLAGAGVLAAWPALGRSK
jgi:hypothetical protein